MSVTESPEKAALRDELQAAATDIGALASSLAPLAADVDPEAFLQDGAALGVHLAGSALHEPDWSRLVEQIDAEIEQAREDFLVVVAARRKRLGLAIGRIR